LSSSMPKCRRLATTHKAVRSSLCGRPLRNALLTGTAFYAIYLRTFARDQLMAFLGELFSHRWALPQHAPSTSDPNPLHRIENRSREGTAEILSERRHFHAGPIWPTANISDKVILAIAAESAGTKSNFLGEGRDVKEASAFHIRSDRC